MTFNSGYYYYQNQDIIKDQNVYCPTGTFNGSLLSFTVYLNDPKNKLGGQLYVGGFNVINPNGATVNKNFIGLNFISPGTYSKTISANAINDGKTPSNSGVITMLDPTPGGSEYFEIVPSNSIRVKYKTDVSATVKRKGHSLKIKISADRNQAFGNYWNYISQPLNRQTVKPKTKADHAVVRRDGHVIARVKLSKYGNGTLTVKDPSGVNHYSVTMVETPSNWQGQATFTK